MCGIAGAVALQEHQKYSPQQLQDIVSAMTHALVLRGPDGFGLWTDRAGHCSLGHRRLAIVDLSDAGKQPMEYGSGRFHISFNGEIYNFRDLAKELQAEGIRFRSTSDTEVLLAAIAHWGLQAAIGKLRGMFAFAIWDAERRVLQLARDRLGEKPLHILEHEGYVFFASEVRALQVIPGATKALSDDAITSYLRYGYVPEPLSIFDGVWKLPPASVLSIPAGQNKALDRRLANWMNRGGGESPSGLAPQFYWSCTNVADEGRRGVITDASAAAEELEALLRSTIRSQMLCDVPIGTFLSGGVDSSAVTAIMQAESSQAVHSFTVSFDNPAFNEADQARRIAHHLGTSHQELRLSEREVMASIPSLISIMDEPTANASIFPVHLISKLARDHAKVILSGDGGDELFAGYNRYRLTPRAWKYLRVLPATLKRILVRALSGQSERRGQFASFFLSRLALGSQVGGNAALMKLARALEAENIGECYDLLTSCWATSAELKRHGELRPRRWSELPVLQAMLLADQEDYLPGDSLAKVDRASMAASLETRLPFLDHRLVEFSWRIPDTMKLNGHQSKALLRSVLYKFVPRELIDRPKMGFSVPVGDWLKGPMREWSGDLLRSASFAQYTGIDREASGRVWDQYLSGQAYSPYQMWGLVALAAWCENTARARSTGRSPTVAGAESRH
jgi:asparagine synthase (glutamine-hydrolysing)